MNTDFSDIAAIVKTWIVVKRIYRKFITLREPNLNELFWNYMFGCVSSLLCDSMKNWKNNQNLHQIYIYIFSHKNAKQNQTVTENAKDKNNQQTLDNVQCMDFIGLCMGRNAFICCSMSK